MKPILLILLLLGGAGYAQTDSLVLHTETAIEDLLEEPGDESDNSDLYELIEYYIENPVNLNKASAQELSDLPYLDISSANLIIEHRKKYGKYFSGNELYAVTALPAGVVQKVLPFVTAAELPKEDKSISDEISLSLRSRVLYDIQQRRGFKDQVFKGSPFKVYNRLNAVFEKVSVGFLTEKDPGEPLYTDFYSGFLELSETYNFDIILGDYRVEFGQGLALWSPYGISKGSDAVFGVKKKSRNIRPYTSAAENSFFRGASAQYKREHLNITGFVSENYTDAVIDTASGFITSVPADGLHRTLNEIGKRKSARESVHGLSLEYSSSGIFSSGFLVYNSQFDHPFIPSNIFDINGSNFTYYSTYTDFYISDINIFGEYSYDGKSLASVSGCRLSPSPGFSYSLIVRNYPRNYINLHGNGFGERSGACQNEFGIYNGIRWRTGLGTLNFYYDQFRFPYATFDNPLPSGGNEFMLHFSSQPVKKLSAETRIKLENKEVTLLENSRNILVRRLKQSYRFDFAYAISRGLRLKTRLEYSYTFFKSSRPAESGYLIFEDMRLQPADNFILFGRAVFFHTDSFNSAIYSYENDLNGILSTTAFYGEGIRIYLAVRYNLIYRLSLSIKYSETYKPKESSTGSGYMEIEGNLDNRIGLQLDFTY